MQDVNILFKLVAKAVLIFSNPSISVHFLNKPNHKNNEFGFIFGVLEDPSTIILVMLFLYVVFAQSIYAAVAADKALMHSLVALPDLNGERYNVSP